jgi:cell division protein FtsB
MIKERPFTDKQSIIQFFSNLIQSRDEHISKLQQRSDNLRQNKKEQYHELAQLREVVDKMGAQYEDLKVKQKNFSNAVIENEYIDTSGHNQA